ncbi:MAG TPA: hypothetical protein PKH07_20765, partial [bacterium]|nr:hypothetical protein [bacterium]
HGTNDVPAMGNVWDSISPETIEAMIYHKPDDQTDADRNGSLSGEVFYIPYSKMPETPGHVDVNWSGRVDLDDLLLIQQNWHQMQE